MATAMAWLFMGRSAAAYRPFDGTDADVADFGEFELELGPVHYYQVRKNPYLLAPATVLNLGILPRFELVADFKNRVPLNPQNGEAGFAFTDIDLLLKAVLRRGVLQDERGPSIAMELGPLLPAVHDKSGFGGSLNVIVSEQFDWLVLHLNDQAALTRGALHFDWFTSLIIEGRVGGAVRPVAELYWEHDAAIKTNTYSALAGAIWAPRKGLDFDVGLRAASQEGDAAFEARLGLTWAFEVWSSDASESKEARARWPRTARRAF